MKWFSAIVAAAAVLFTAAAGAQQPALPSHPTGFVMDLANVLSPEQRTNLETQLTSFRDGLPGNPEIEIVTLSSLDGRDPTTLASDIGNNWHVGNRAHDNGTVILIYPGTDRYHVTMAPSNGISNVLNDAKVGRILDETMVPNLARSHLDIYAGLTRCVEATRVELANAGAAALEQSSAAPQPRSSSNGGGAVLPILVIAFFIASFVGRIQIWASAIVGVIAGVVLSFVLATGFPGLLSLIVLGAIGGVAGLFVGGMASAAGDGGGGGGSSFSDDDDGPSFGGGSFGGGGGGFSTGGGGGFGGGGASR